MSNFTWYPNYKQKRTQNPSLIWPKSFGLVLSLGTNSSFCDQFVLQAAPSSELSTQLESLLRIVLKNSPLAAFLCQGFFEGLSLLLMFLSFVMKVTQRKNYPRILFQPTEFVTHHPINIYIIRWYGGFMVWVKTEVRGRDLESTYPGSVRCGWPHFCTVCRLQMLISRIYTK